MTKTFLSKTDKEKISKEVLDIVMFHIRVLERKPTKENIDLAMTMFIEGVKYWEENKTL